MTMRQVKRISGDTSAGEIARMALVITVLILIVGIWACLWVPPFPIL
jgi:hypothetical protein